MKRKNLFLTPVFLLAIAGLLNAINPSVENIIKNGYSHIEGWKLFVSFVTAASVVASRIADNSPIFTSKFLPGPNREDPVN